MKNLSKKDMTILAVGGAVVVGAWLLMKSNNRVRALERQVNRRAMPLNPATANEVAKQGIERQALLSAMSDNYEWGA